MREISDQLMDLAQKMRLGKKLANDLYHVQQELSIEKKRLSDHFKRLEKEQQDVKKLEGISLTGLFYRILGSKNDQLDIERQEALAALLKWEQCSKTCESLINEEKAIRERLFELTTVEKEYWKVLKLKEDWILAAGNLDSDYLFNLSEDIAALKSDKKELREALNAGEVVKAELDKALCLLNSAGSWGTWDLLGGGLIATAVKHSKIDEAKEAVGQVQVKIQRFHRELKDVDALIPAIQIEIGSFAAFADIFFDGLIADWVVQSKINDSRQQVIRTATAVENVLGKLRAKLNSVTVQLAKKEDDYQSFIENN